jgi:hypothetical protein
MFDLLGPQISRFPTKKRIAAVDSRELSRASGIEHANTAARIHGRDHRATR